MREINKKIVGFSVKNQEASENLGASASGNNSNSSQEAAVSPQKTEMNENIGRPDILLGSTYKISKSPASEHAMYITINDIILDQGTAFERRRPFEIFINSKNMDQFQWVVALTRILSAVFRKGGDVTFIVDEMKAVFDPHGGFWRKGTYVPSLIAEIGNIVEMHLKSLGMIESGVDPAALSLIEEKKKHLTALSASAETPSPAQSENESEGAQFPANATMCNKCYSKAVVILDGCATCLNCGNSKCG